MSWHDDSGDVSVLGTLALNRETVRRTLLELRMQHSDPKTGRMLSQDAAARRVGRGVTGRTWQRWEAMEVTPRRPNLEAVAETFDFPVERFYDEEADGPDTTSVPPLADDLRELRHEVEEMNRKLDILLNR